MNAYENAFVHDVKIPDHYPRGLPSLTPLPDGKNWLVNKDCSIDLSLYGYGVITVEKDTIINFASIPWWAKWLYQPATGKHRYGSIWHDYLYGKKLFSRKETDEIYKLIMELDGFRQTGVEVMYNAVRLGGWVAWNKGK